ncbi:MAG: hypothetical protein GC155_08450 [Alphaproteobacteria bacterium]|nr:hypothetical protein [Alphaproteobacteria bacterium]
MTEAAPPLVPGRSCAGCTACCKLPAVEALAKPPQTWCDHCDIGAGCRIYDARPEECRTFYCGWVLDASIPEDWRPERCRMVVKFEPRRIVIHVDKDRRDAWRREPFNSQIRRWAEMALAQRGEVIVRDGRDVFQVFPAGERRL